MVGTQRDRRKNSRSHMVLKQGDRRKSNRSDMEQGKAREIQGRPAENRRQGKARGTQRDRRKNSRSHMVLKQEDRRKINHSDMNRGKRVGRNATDGKTALRTWAGERRKATDVKSTVQAWAGVLTVTVEGN